MERTNTKNRNPHRIQTCRILFLLSLTSLLFLATVPMQAQEANNPPELSQAAQTTMPGAQSLNGQPQSWSLKRVEKMEFPSEPVEIQFMQTDLGKMVFNKQVWAGDDWLSGASIQVKNLSNQPIRYMSLAVVAQAAESQANGRQVGRGLTRLEFGTLFDQKASTAFRTMLLPEQVTTLSLAPEEYQSFKSLLEKKGTLSAITQVQVSIQYVLFENQEMWAGGHMFSPDASGLRWIRKDLPVVDLKGGTGNTFPASPIYGRDLGATCRFLYGIEAALYCRNCNNPQAILKPLVSNEKYGGDTSTENFEALCSGNFYCTDVVIFIKSCMAPPPPNY